MTSEYVLFCAPYRFEQDYLKPLTKQKVEKDLFSAIMPGVNMLTRKLILAGIKNNYDIVDKQSLEFQVDALENGDAYKSPINKEELLKIIQEGKQKQALMQILEMAKDRYDQGFDDCRIIDVITKSYAGKLIDDEEFREIFFKQAQRIQNSYESWEQYLASCVIGKLIQLVDSSITIKTSEEYVNDIYSYCIAPTNVFSFATFWTNSNLDNLGRALADFMNVEFEKIDAPVVKEDGPSAELLSAFDEMYLSKDLIDKGRFEYLNEMADFVFYSPIVENELDWLLKEEKREQEYILLPSEFFGLESGRDFWQNYAKFEELKNENIFAFFVGNFDVKAIFTEKNVYTIKKKLFGKPTLNPIKWSDVKLTSKVEFLWGVNILLDGKKILEVFDPDYSKIGLGKSDIKALGDDKVKELGVSWEQKMNKVLSEIPQKIEEFKKIKSML